MNYTKIFLLWALGLVLCMGLIEGCGSKVWQINYYYYPNWTPDGKIICMKEVRTYQEVASPAGVQTSSKYYITIMSDEGTQEADIKQVSGIGDVSASPKGNYIAYSDGAILKIITLLGKEISARDMGAEINGLGWSPNEENLVFSIYKTGPSWEIYSIPKDNTSDKVYLTPGYLGEWSQDGEYIAYDLYIYLNNAPIDGGLYLFKVSDRNIIKLTTMEGAAPGFIKPKSDYLVYMDKGWIKRLNIINNIRDNIIKNDVLSSPKCNYDGMKIIYGEGPNSGIWVSNINGNDLRQIK